MRNILKASAAFAALVWGMALAEAQNFLADNGTFEPVYVENNTELRALAAGVAPRVVRNGFAAAGDGGGATYNWSASACSLNAGAGDNGSQVAPNSGTGCWIADFRGHANAIVWGADPTGATSSDAAFAAATSALAGTGGRLEVSAGRYSLTGAAQITLSHVEVACIGAPSDETVASTEYGKIGATFWITGTSTAPFLVGSGWRVHGCNFFWPDQVESPTAPIAYPPLLTGSAIGGATFDNNTVINAYDFLAITSPGFGAGDVHIAHNHMFVLRRFLDVENGVPDIVTISDNFISYGVYEYQVLFNPGGTTYLKDYATANSVLVYVNNGSASYPSMDGLTISRNIIFGYRYGIYVASGRMDMTKIDSNNFDGTQTVMSVQGTSTTPSTIFSNNTVYSYRAGYTDACNPVFDLQTTGPVISGLTSTGNKFTFSRGGVFYVNNNTSFRTLSSVGDAIESWGQCANATEWPAFGLVDSQLNAVVNGDIIRASASGGNTFTAFNLNLSSAVISNNRLIATNINFRTTAGEIRIFNNIASSTVNSSVVDTTGAPSTVMSKNNTWDKVPTIYNYPSFRAVISAPQTFTGAKTQADFGTERYDDGANFASSAFTAPWAGAYECSAQLTYTAGATAADVWELSLETSGTQIASAYKTIYAGDGVGSVQIYSPFHLAANETVIVYLTRTSGAGNFVEPADANSSFFSCKQIN